MPPDVRELRRRMLRIEEDFPEFRSCVLENDVAMIYGWGAPMAAWQNYCELKEMLHVSA